MSEMMQLLSVSQTCINPNCFYLIAVILMHVIFPHKKKLKQSLTKYKENIKVITVTGMDRMGRDNILD